MITAISSRGLKRCEAEQPVQTLPEPDPDKDEWAYSGEYLGSVIPFNDKIYLIKQFYNERYINEEYSSDNGMRVYCVDSDGSGYRMLTEFRTENRSTDTGYYYTGIDQIAPASDGSYWYSERTEDNDWSDPNEYKYNSTVDLVHAAADGTELLRISLSDIASDESGYFYVQNLFLTDTGELIVYSNSALYVFSDDGTLKKQIPLTFSENKWINSLTATGSGDVICLVID